MLYRECCLHGRCSLYLVLSFMRRYVFQVLLFISSVTATAQNRDALVDSLRELNRQIDLNIDSVDLHLKKAAINIELDQWNYALKEYDDILQGQPYNPAALFYRAYVYEHKREYPMARADYEKLLKMFPHHFEARMALTLVNQKDGKSRDAYDQANKLVESFPDSVLSYVVRAEIEDQQGYTDLAINDMDEAITRSPKDNELYIRRARYYIKKNDLESARKDLDAAVVNGANRMALRDLYSVVDNK